MISIVVERPTAERNWNVLIVKPGKVKRYEFIILSVDSAYIAEMAAKCLRTGLRGAIATVRLWETRDCPVKETPNERE